jgi:hypothetical protein
MTYLIFALEPEAEVGIFIVIGAIGLVALVAMLVGVGLMWSFIESLMSKRLTELSKDPRTVANSLRRLADAQERLVDRDEQEL